MKSKITRLPLNPPEPTYEQPYVQLDWLCERFVMRYKNDSTRKTIRNTVRAYKTLLSKCHGYDDRLVNDSRFLLAVHCDQLVLHNAALYWREKKLSPHTMKNRLNLLKALFSYAAGSGLTASTVFFPSQIGPLQRTTQFRVAYEDLEIDFIRKTLAPFLDYAVRIVGGYKQTGVGVDARRKSRQATNKPRSFGGGNESCHGYHERLWAKWENMVWYFENVMKCCPLRVNKENAAHDCFFQAASKYHSGINAVYFRLGVTPIINIDLIAPLAIKLCLETGLNTETLLNLRRDCLKESHPLTGSPYIRYYKARSTGEKDLHLGLFDPIHDQMQLQHKQSLIIRRTIQAILRLTEPLISQAKEPDKDFLFLYQADSCGTRPGIGRVIRLNIFYFSHWSHSLLSKQRSAGEKNVPEVLNLGRCRPTKITQMVREGKDFFEIQAIAGHASASTTLKYLASHQIAPQARREVSATLSRIHENAEDFNSNPKPYATAETQRQKDVIYKGVFCDCKNVYDPPANVRRLPTYKEGQPCTYYNMCLTCPNVLIIKKHLPLLISYQNEIGIALSGGLNNAPNSTHYEKSFAILDGIMREFDGADVEWAREIAVCADYHLDPLTHRSMTNDA